MSRHFHGPGIAAQPPLWLRLFQAALLLGTAALAAILLLGDPERGLLKRNVSPLDMPWEGFGIAEVYITPEGKWLVTRREYADRVPRYVIEPGGGYATLSESIRPYQGADVSGSFTSNRQVTPQGSSLRVTSRRGTGYRQWMQDMRSENMADYLNPLGAGEASDRGAAPLNNEFVGPQRLTRRQQLDRLPGGIRVVFNQHDRLVPVDILPEHWLYEVYDAACYVHPYIYTTTDRQRLLFKLRIDESGPEPTVAVESSVPLPGDGAPAFRRCRVLSDPLRGICVLRHDGRRLWFDPQTLEPAGRDQLPGVWDQEYASFDLRRGPHNAVLGTPLTKLGYDRIMQAAMVVFLASLLGLALLWRPQWKSTSAATTADSSSSAGSPRT